jgi:hypothetical protein
MPARGMVAAMDSAFQIVAMTDRPTGDGKHEVEIYAATTRTEEDALALAKAELPSTWQLKVVYGFRYGEAIVRDHEMGRDQLVRIL